jgi:general secretion pathway protein G
MKSTDIRRPRGGFTLVEMLVVLAILVLLVSMVVPRIMGSQKKADINATKSQIGMFKAALERYALDCKKYPSTEQGLAALVTKPSDLAETASWDGPYLTGDIIKDPWGGEYQYKYPPEKGSGDNPDIWSFGPDGEDNTEDDICSWTGSSSGRGRGGDVIKEKPAETRTKPRTESRTEPRRESTAPKRSTTRSPTPRTEKKPTSPL